METMFLCRFFNLLFCLSDQNQIAYFSVKGFDPLIIAGLFVVSAADQQGRTVHCLDSLDCCIRVGSLGIVVVCNSVFLCHIFDSVCNCGKLTDALSDAFHGNTVIICHGNCCHNVLKVMFSKQFQVCGIYHFDLFCTVFENDLISIQINTFFQFTFTGEVDNSRNQMLSEFTENFILIVQYTDILCSLILCDQFFYTDVFFHCMMAV